MNSSITRFIRIFAFLMVAVALMTPTAAAERGKGRGKGGEGEKAHPNMHEALDALRKAKTSADPIADLNDAHRRLKLGKQNKEGYRAEAMKLIQQAIEELKAKKMVEAGKHIDEAISKVEKSVAVSPQR